MKNIIVFAFLLFGTAALFAQNSPVGWASFNGGTTGGFGGQVVTVTSRAEFVQYAASPDPYTIAVRDTIDLNLYERVNVGPNKTIIGITTNAMLRYGGLEINGNNVIVKNLIIKDSYDGDWSGKTNSTDAITIQSHNVWIDHCWLASSADGLLDIRSASSTRLGNYVTVSYTRFSDHNKVSLIGSSDDSTRDRDHLKVTFHHCWFDGTIEKGLHQRNPRIRYGDVHLFNNYFEDIASYCILARWESDVVVENNYFRNSNNPHGIEDVGKGIKDPELVASGNHYEYSGGEKKTSGTAFNPSEFYSYELDDVMSLPAQLMNQAGPPRRSNNTPPVAGEDRVFLETGNRSFDLDVLANDYDEDGDEIRLAGVANQPDGIILIRFNELRYIGESNPTKPDTILYEVVDLEGGYTLGTLIVDFEGVSTSTKEIPETNLVVFPNPASDQLTIQLPEGWNADSVLSLTDINGKMIDISQSKSGVMNNHITIKTHNIPSGYYFITISSEDGIITKKVIITQ